ncbi:MAG: methionine biosynthesis protein MetW [Chloroflexi bacterium]|nr:methionine biosynthesis protein MetW [Chloroflexota bacterium]|tara:strand:- start:2201 stop:2890 length:690 start_codon:yes stop_codon:yes gene_type:complete
MNLHYSIRKDWNLIESLIDNKSTILDIGCGEGDLIQQLQNNKHADIRGVEIDGELVRSAISRGLSVVQGNAEKDLTQYCDQSFDYVILSQTLQAMYNPKQVLNELLRIGAKAIVSFPNFGHWRIRAQLLFKGKMPVTHELPYAWYDTPNIHFFTLKDFLEMCKMSNIYIERSIGLTSKGRQFEITSQTFTSNIITNEAIFLLSKKKYEPIKIKTKQKIFSSSAVIANQR